MRIPVIRQPIWAYISGALLLVALGFVVERVLFLQKAEQVTGVVSDISSYNDRCGRSGKHRRRYACTKYNATIDFTTLRGESVRLTVSAGSTRGQDRPISNASKRVNQSVAVVYDPDNPAKAYEDTLFGVWGVPILIFIFQIAAMIGSLTKGRRDQQT
jgi:hypothetical protein